MMGNLTANHMTALTPQNIWDASFLVNLSTKEYRKLIDNESDDWPQVNLWMQEECEGNILVIWGHLNVYFELESDAMAFKLRWF